VRLATLIFVCIVGSVATAAADNAGEATRLFDEGRALFEAGQFGEACAKFAKSYELDRTPGAQLNVGDCAEREGQFRRAYLLFDDVSREYERIRIAADAQLVKDPASEEARRNSIRAVAGARLARERATGLAPKLARVVVRLAEPRVDGLAVRIGDRAVPPGTEIVEHVDAGIVTVTASAPGREAFTSTVAAEAGKQVVIDIAAMRVLGGNPNPNPLVDRAGKRQQTRVRIAYGLGAGGLVLLAVSGVVGLQARSQYNDAEKSCDRDAAGLVCPSAAAGEIDSAGNKADLATYVAIGGAALVASAVVVYFTAPRERITVAPMASSTGAGISVLGRF